MRITQFAGLLALAGSSYAFPAYIMEQVKDDMLQPRGADPKTANDAQAIFEPIPVFNAKRQFIDVSDNGPNKFVPPGPTDLRGPCPGLNAFANHNFLPHNGFATTAQFFEVTQHVVSMGPLIAGFLSTLGSTIDGDGLGWSIGGTPPKSIGSGNGLIGSHNKYESDASPMRPDLYQFGNDYAVRVDQFQTLSDLHPLGDEANFDLETLTKFRHMRFNKQVATNPYFFNGPFSGVFVQPAAYTFMYRFMANHSEEYPYGHLSRSNIMSWFGIRGKDGNYKSHPGHERIPYNWYRRSELYPYEQTYFQGDLANAARIYPEFANIGGNLGKPNTFTGVDVSDLTGGAFNSKNLLDGNNLGCLALEFSTQAKPDVANVAFSKLQAELTKNLAKLGCPQLVKADRKQLRQFPGYRRSQKGVGV